MNKVILTGRLTADPELRQTQSGISSCRFTVAVSRSFKNEKGEYDADFISCIAWRQTAEFVSKYFNKGSMIALEGTLRTGSYQDKNHADIKHYTTDVYVDSVEFCGSKSNKGNNPPDDYYTPPLDYNARQSGNVNQSQNSATVQPTQEQTQRTAERLGGMLDEFVEILGDGDVPF